jgi:hypothetical protein
MVKEKIRSWLSLSLLVGIVLVATHQPAFAQAVGGKRFALVVGNSAYADRPLRNAANGCSAHFAVSVLTYNWCVTATAAPS